MLLDLGLAPWQLDDFKPTELDALLAERVRRSEGLDLG